MEALQPARVALPALIDRERRRHRRRLWSWWISAALLPALGAAGWLALRPRPAPLAERFRTEMATQGDILRDVRATGHVEAVSTVQVGAEISGRIATVHADYNDRVKRDQVLARFDKSALDAQRAQIQAGVAAARAAVAQAEYDLAQAQRNLLRAEKLYLERAQSDAEHDAARTAAQLAQARLHAAASQLEAQEAALSLARTNLDHAVVRAPVDGVVITRNIDPGQTVASVLQTPVLFTVAADLRKMRVIAAVDEADIGEVAVGQNASFTVNAYPDRSFAGVVTEVRNSPVIVQDVVTYGAVISVANDDLALKPGMTASARIRTGTRKDVLRAPTAALQFVPPGEHRLETPSLWVLDGGPRRVLVETGLSDGEWTEIRGPLAPGRALLVDLTPKGKKAYEH